MHLRMMWGAYSSSRCWIDDFSLLRLPLGRPRPNVLPGGNGRPRGLSIWVLSIRHARPAILCDLIEGPGVRIQERLPARVLLPPPDADVHVVGVDFDAAGLPLQILASYDRGARSQERIEHHISRLAAVANGALHEFHWFHSGMKVVSPGLVDQPYIALIAISAPKMFGSFAPPIEDRLVLTLIVRAA